MAMGPMPRRVRLIKSHVRIIAKNPSVHNRREDGFRIGDLPTGDKGKAEMEAIFGAGEED